MIPSMGDITRFFYIILGYVAIYYFLLYGIFLILRRYIQYVYEHENETLFVFAFSPLVLVFLLIPSFLSSPLLIVLVVICLIITNLAYGCYETCRKIQATWKNVFYISLLISISILGYFFFLPKHKTIYNCYANDIPNSIIHCSCLGLSGYDMCFGLSYRCKADYNVKKECEIRNFIY